MDQVNPNQTMSSVSTTLNALFQSVWDGVAIKNVEKMAPRSTHGEACWHIQSFVQMAFTEKQKQQTYKKDCDPIAPKIDCLGSGSIEIEDKKVQSQFDKHSSQRKMTEFSQFSDTKSRLNQTKTGKLIGTDKKLQNNDAEVIAQKVDPYIKIQEKIKEIDPSENDQKFRKQRNDRDLQKIKTKKYLEDMEKQRLSRKLKNQKTMKDKKNITFDYEGSFFGIKQQKPPQQKIVKLNQAYGDSKVVLKQLRSIQASRVELSRDIKPTKSSLQKEIPIFTQTPLLITEALTDDKIQAGVKVTEEVNEKDKIIREKKPRKLSGIKMYRLNEFKNYSKDILFKQHPRHGSKAAKSSYDILNFGSSIENKQELNKELNKTISVLENSESRGKSKSAFENQANQTSKLIGAALGRGLPFIRTKGYRMNDLGSQFSMKSSQVSSFYKKSQKSRNKILIGNNQLFEYNITIDH